MDTIEITLPVSGKKVEIRNYTTRNDDEKAEHALYLGVDANIEEAKKGKDGKANIRFPMANLTAQNHIYIRRLVQSIDGDSTNVALALGELRSADYEAIEAAVEKIVEENSPKVKEAKKASANATSEK